MTKISVVSIADSEAMQDLSDQVHDLDIDVKRIRWDRTNGEVIVPLCRAVHRGLLKKPDFHEVGQLHFAGVEHMDLEDSERVGYYDVVHLRVSSREVAFVTGVPLRLVLRGTAMTVSARLRPHT